MAGTATTWPVQRLRLVWVCGGAAVALGLLTAAVVTRAAILMRPDAAVTRAAVAVVHDHPAILDLFRAITRIGDPLSVDVVCAVWVVAALWRRQWPVAIAVIAARLISLGGERILKATVDRPRPHVVHPVEPASGASFPSGHTTGTAAIAVLAIVLLWAGRTRDGSRWRWAITALLALVIVAVAASRVMLGVHYLSDVLAGACLGLAVATGTVLASRSIRAVR